MKVVSTDGLTKLIQLIKGSFISNSDTVNVSTVTLANVATTGEYSDIANTPTLANVATTGKYSDLLNTPTIPTVDQAYNASSTNAQSGVAVKSAIDTAISSVYKPSGTSSFANLPTPSSNNEGYVYNVNDSFTTDSRFIEGSGKIYPEGTNLVIVQNNPTYYAWYSSVSRYDSKYYTLSETPVVNDIVYDNNGNPQTNFYITSVTPTAIVLNKAGTYNRSSTNDITGDYAFDVLSGFVDLSGYVTSNSIANVATTGDYADLTNTPTIPVVTNMQTTTNMVDVITNASTNTTYPTASAVYNIVGDIESILHQLNSGS